MWSGLLGVVKKTLNQFTVLHYLSLIMKIKHIGYHATREILADKIISDGYKYDHRNDHWLGQGIYFFKYIEHARHWGNTDLQRSGFNYIILKSFFSAKKELILDLDDPDGLKKFYSLVSLIMRTSEQKLEFDMSDMYINLCFFLDIIKEMESLEIISFTFRHKDPKWGERIIRDSGILMPLTYNQTQYCVTSNSSIENTIVGEKNEKS